VACAHQAGPALGCGAQGLQAAFWLWVPLLLAAARPQRAGFRRRAAIMAGASKKPVQRLAVCPADWRLYFLSPPAVQVCSMLRDGDTGCISWYVAAHASTTSSGIVQCLRAMAWKSQATLRQLAGWYYIALLSVPTLAIQCTWSNAPAGVVISLSTAYRAWLDWRAEVRLPIVAFGSPDMEELLDFVKYLVSGFQDYSGQQQ
jgi:hypothetical protein